MKYPIPSEALDDRLAWTGTSGTGKTYDAGTAIEKVLHAKSRVCIVDPLGVWWGLRLRSDGKTPGFKVAIFGGPHGDIAITETSGKLIGETVAGTKESCIIDLSEFDTDASQRRFMLAFLVALYGGLKGDLLHLVLDEADMWAPQRILDKEGDATKLHHNVQKIVRRGRVKGFIPWLITQRTAEISKSILSMTDGMVMHQATSPQDIDAVMDWVRARATKTVADDIEKRLPAFDRGEAVVYIPRRKVLNIAQFPKKVSFDSSRSPERGEKKNRPDIALKPLDIDALKKRLEKVEAEAKANDPSALKSEIAKLKREKAELERAKPAPPDAAALTARQEKAIQRAGVAGKVEGYADAMKAIGEMTSGVKSKAVLLAHQLDVLLADVTTVEKWATREAKKPTALAPFTKDDVAKAVQQSGSPGIMPANSPARAAGAPTTARSTPAPAASGDGTLTGSMRETLEWLAW